MKHCFKGNIHSSNIKRTLSKTVSCSSKEKKQDLGPALKKPGGGKTHMSPGQDVQTTLTEGCAPPSQFRGGSHRFASGPHLGNGVWLVLKSGFWGRRREVVFPIGGGCEHRAARGAGVAPAQAWVWVWGRERGNGDRQQ